MKLAQSLPPTLRIDALGALTTIAFSAGALVIAVGPRIFSPAPSHAQQQADLDARIKKSLDIDRQAELAQHAFAKLQSESVAAVKLKPASTMNQRLGDIAALAEPLGISITKLVPGPTAAPLAAASTTPATPATPAPPPLTTILSIKLAGTGSYPAISRFLHTMHDNFRDTALSTLKLSTPLEARQSENSLATFSIDLTWYAAPEGSDGAAHKQ